MPGPFDTTTKYLVQTYPRDWIRFIGVSNPGEIEVIDADLSTVTAAADKIIRLSEPQPWLVHLEFQASYDPDMGRRLARYNLLLSYTHDLEVLSVLVLLRPQADGPATGGRWRSRPPAGQGWHDFGYPVLRVWTEPVERLLDGPLGLLPLAPLADLSRSDLPAVVRALERRIDAEANAAQAQALEVVTFTLMGLRYSPELARQLLPGVRNMRESTTYQAILDEGRAEGRAEGEVRGRAEGEVRGRAEGEVRGRAVEARRLVVLLGTARFGVPGVGDLAALEAIADPERLEQLAQRVLSGASWAEVITDQ